MANFRRTEIVLRLTSKQQIQNDWNYWNTESYEEVEVSFLFSWVFVCLQRSLTVADYI